MQMIIYETSAHNLHSEHTHRLTLMRRPRLKSRCVTPNSGKITIMQPVKNLLLLAQTRISLSILSVLSTAVPKCGFAPFLRALLVIRLFPTAANEQHIADSDVATLRSGPDVDALVLAALVELLPGDGVVVVGIVVNALLVGVATVVEEDASARDAMLGPVVDGAFVLSTWSA